MVSKSYLPASAAGKGMTVVSGVVAAAACLTPAGIVCLFSPFCVCVPTQPGVSNPRSGPHGRRDAADWSQRVFSALPGVRLHHHASRWHVSETLCTQASVSAACRATQQSICTSKHWFTCPNKHGHSPVVSLALGPTLACATIYLWHDCCPPDQYGKMQKKKKKELSNSGRVVLAVIQEAIQTNWNSSTLCPRTIPHANVTVVEAILNRAV